MTGDPRKSRRRLVGQGAAPYDVGYARPPEGSRFRKGQSGNPRGRPKGAKSKLPRLNEERLKNIILTEAYRTIKIREGEKNVTLSMAEAVLRSISVSAAKGKPRAQRLFTQLLEKTELANKRLADEWLQTAIEYKIGWEQEIERRKHLGLPDADPIPHPDHIEIDMKTGEVIIKGPFTPEEKKKWDDLRKRKKECEASITELKDMLHDRKMKSCRKQIEDEIQHEMRLIEIISRVIKD